MAKTKRPLPLAGLKPPMKSRKVARQITTQFHKLTHERNALLKNPTSSSSSRIIKTVDLEIEKMGGRQAYQEASQLSTSIFSTSKWVIGQLGKLSILSGIPIPTETSTTTKKVARRPVSILEVGAINTQLKVASTKPGTLLNVRSIDLRSTNSQIEEADFLTLPLTLQPYDVIVCSMVINCVPTPHDRGLMLKRLYEHLEKGGVCFLMLPLLCLNNSPNITKGVFLKIMQFLGFEIDEVRETPKIFFGVFRKPLDLVEKGEKVVEERKRGEGRETNYKKLVTYKTGKKYRNTFAICFGD